jgi:hypothetical protein
MLHVEDFIEIYCLSNNKTPRGMAERESATCADIIDDFCNSSIFTTKFTTN